MEETIYNTTAKQEKIGVLLGMLLGDAGLTTSNNIYYGHSIKQKEYALFKKQLLDNITGKDSHISYITQYGYDAIRVYPKTSDIIKETISLLYINRKKNITKSVLDKVTLQGLAIWFMDDGSCSVGKHNGIPNGGLKVTLNTYLTLENNQELIEYFRDVWQINWYNNYSKGKYRLGMGTKESRKFFDLIKPYVIPEMQYKLKKSISELHGAS